MSDLGVVVLSCDKYSDLWRPYFSLFFRAWPNCPFPLYLAANRRTFEDQRVTTVHSGDDVDWSSSVRRALSQISEPNVLFLYDDAFLSQPVSTPTVLRHLEWFSHHEANYLRMRPSPPPDELVDSHVGLIRPRSLYRTALFGSIWRRTLALDILKDGESAWAFELQSPQRAVEHAGFYSTQEPVFTYVHGVEKGKWLPWSVLRLRRLGIDIDLSQRPMMSSVDCLRYFAKAARGQALRSLPPAARPVVLAWNRELRRRLRSTSAI